MARVPLFVALTAVVASGSFLISYFEGLRLFDAFYFVCITLMTIGYGDITPQTFMGRLIFMALSAGGLGIFGLLVESLGKFYTDNVAISLSKQARLWSVQSAAVSPAASKIIAATLGVPETCLFIVTLLAGSITFTFFTHDPGLPSTLFDSLYFSMATATTCGFGDFHPQTDAGKVCCIIYSIFSLHASAVFANHVGSRILRSLSASSSERGVKVM